MRFAYGAREVLRGIDLVLEPASLVALVGPNGGGKSTLLRVAAGMLPPSAGTVRWHDQDIGKIAPAALARSRAYVPQEFAPAFPFRVGELVLMGRYPHRGFARFETAADLETARSAMERADVWTLRDRRYDELSGGERRRVLLAQAFCQSAQLLLLDEPTAALDPAHGLAVFATLCSERDRHGVTAIAATHDLNLAARFADRVILLHEGVLAADGPASAVLSSAAASRAFEVTLHVGVLPSGTSYVVPS